MFGRFELLDRIGLGGMAEVWRARVAGVGGFEKIQVVKKILPAFAQNKTFIDMLLAEARLCAVLQHGNIVQTYDNGEIDGVYYIAMEYVPGPDLFKLLSRATQVGMRIPPEICLFIAAEAAKGLNYAHNARDHYGRPLHIIHRDVSPSNIIISDAGEVKVMDFGVARATPNGQTSENATRSGVLKGKLGYMSPEQVTGQPFDHRSDIFSLGIILYESLTLKRLFLAKTDLETLVNIRDARIEHKFRKHDYIDEATREILRKALSRDVNVRYPTALAMHEDIVKMLFESKVQVSSNALANFIVKLFDPALQPLARTTAPVEPPPITKPQRVAPMTPDGPPAVRPVADGTATAGEPQASPSQVTAAPNDSMPLGPVLGHVPAPAGAVQLLAAQAAEGVARPAEISQSHDISTHSVRLVPPPAVEGAAEPAATNSLSFSPDDMRKIRDKIAEKRAELAPELAPSAAAIPASSTPRPLHLLREAPGPVPQLDPVSVSSPHLVAPPPMVDRGQSLRGPTQRMEAVARDAHTDPELVSLAPKVDAARPPLDQPRPAPDQPRTPPEQMRATVAQMRRPGAAAGGDFELAGRRGAAGAPAAGGATAAQGPADTATASAAARETPPQTHAAQDRSNYQDFDQNVQRESSSTTIGSALKAPSSAVYRLRTADGQEFGPLAKGNLAAMLRARTALPDDMVSVDDGPFQAIRTVLSLRLIVETECADAPKAQFEGTLTQWLFVQVVFRMFADRKTGCLELRRGDAVKTLYFRRGRVQYIASNQQSELLGPFMVANGFISQADVDMAVGKAKSTGGKLGDLLIGLNLIKPFQLYQVLERQLRAKFIDAFGWDTGTYAYFDAIVPPDDIVPLDVDPISVLAEGVRERVPLSVLEPQFADKLDKPLYRSANPVISVGALRFQARESKALSQLLASPTPRAAFEESYSNRQHRLALLHVLFILLQTDLLTFDKSRA